jgi:transposase-like protein
MAAKNKIQFQKAMSLHTFQSEFGTLAQCRAQLFQYRWPQGFTCPQCGSRKYSELGTRDLYQCHQCRYQCSLTSRTIFSSSKIPLTIWFLAIFLITQSKEGISSLKLSRLLGVSANAALRIKHKLQLVMKSADDSMPLDGLIQVDDAYWGGVKHGGKRGRGAPGKTPFLAAISRNEKGHPIHIRFSRIGSFSAQEIGSWATKHLHGKTIVITDGLACFSEFDRLGHIHGSVVTRGTWQNPQFKTFKWLNTALGNVKTAIRGTYHKLSHDHLPRYLAEFCFRFHRRFQMELMVPDLIKISAEALPIPQRQLKLAEDWW